MHTLTTRSRALLNAKDVRTLQEELDISIQQNAQGYWCITSNDPQTESIAVRWFNWMVDHKPVIRSAFQ